ncbi:hypothetical protein Tco_1152085 [Tanacetum coccineum]
MTTLKFANTHNMVAFLSKPAESDGFEQIVDFLNAQPIRYALTVNPVIYISCIKQFWSTGVVKTINGEVQLHALVYGKKIIIFEASVRRDLKLEDEEGVDCLPNSTIFEQLALMGEGSAMPTDPQHTPTFIQPSPPPQKTQKPRKPKRKDTQVPQPSGPTDIVADEAVHKELGDSLVVVPGIDDDDEITLVSVQDDVDAKMFDVGTLTGDEVFAEQEVAAKDVNLTIDEVTLAQALAALKSVKPKKMFDRAFKRVNTFVNFRTDLVKGSSKRVGEELEQKSTKKQKVDEDKDTTEL